MLQSTEASGFEVHVPGQRLVTAHHTPAHGALVPECSQQEMEIIHAGEWNRTKTRYFQSSPSVAVAIGREEAVLHEGFESVDGTGVLEDVVLELVHPVLAVETNDIEEPLFHEGDGAGDLRGRHRQFRGPRHDEPVRTTPDGFLTAVSHSHGGTRVLAPAAVLDGDDAVAFGSELALDGESRRRHTFGVDSFGQRATGFGVGDDDEAFDFVGDEDLAESADRTGELGHVIGLAGSAGLKQAGNHSDSHARTSSKVGFLGPSPSSILGWESCLKTRDLVSHAEYADTKH